MAASLPPFTWRRGFQEGGPDLTPAWADESNFISESGEPAHYSISEPAEKPTSLVANEHGLTSLRSWPGLYNGTQASEAPPSWWKPSSEVDVLISGAGPFGLAVAMNLARQGISFRIVDQAEGPCHAGRADSIQPRALEYLQAWGIGEEVTEEGPIVNKLIMHRDGDKLVNNYTMQADSRFRGNHILTQGQIEKIFIRDLLRHGIIVDRCTTVTGFENDCTSSHPIAATIVNNKMQQHESIRAKYLVGSDGASSHIRELMGVPFDGMATDCLWTIMDAQFKTDYPHILDFSIVISSEHGGVILVPRENGVTRAYVQVPAEKAHQVAEARKRMHREKLSGVGETQVYDHGITPEESLEQFNKIIAPHKIEFAGPMSWFAVWRVNERVARSFSSPDQRLHIGGDAAHVHSVLGAFGLNSSLYDASNLAWKLALCARGAGDPTRVLPTYDTERRIFANRVIRFSGQFLRFVCNADLPLAKLRGLKESIEPADDPLPTPGMNTAEAKQFLGKLFGQMPKFMTGLQWPVQDTVLSPANIAPERKAARLDNGVRAPDCRVSLSASRAGYLYDAMMGGAKFHILIFASDMQGPAREKLALLSKQGFGPQGFFSRFGKFERFNVTLVVKALPQDMGKLLSGADLQNLRDVADIVFDDRAPDEDAHYCYGINHARGGCVVVRPDLVIGTSAWPEDAKAIEEYFQAFLTKS